jgi:hypothetical protein
MKCSLRINGQCTNDAVEILWIKPPGGIWEPFPRCSEHPAASYIPVISRMRPGTLTRIDPIR